ncbi:NAD(P)-binding protein [Xylaria sp. FL1042]|nr:NAD(P)-binding protein [Xylaria sp. FL1042]
MDRPFQDPLLIRTAQHLETLPFELVELVLKELPFFRALDLFHCGGERLREAIRYHPHWTQLFGGETDELEYLWSSLNQLFWAQYRRPWDLFTHEARGPATLWFPVDTNTLSTKNHIISTLDQELEAAFFTLVGLENYMGSWVSTPELKAVVHYLPDDSTLAYWAKPDATPDEKEPKDRFAENFVRGFQEDKRSLDITQILFELKNAYLKLFQKQSDELKKLADLYERFPRFLKVANAPEQPTSETHVLAGLHRDARGRSKSPRWHLKEIHTPQSRNLTLKCTPYRFRYPHPTLVPFEWCLRLFKVVTERSGVLEIKERLPLQLKAHFDRAVGGVDHIYCETPKERLKRTDGDTGENATFIQYPFSSRVLPKPQAEIDWLESFVTVAEWLTKEFPDITRSVASTQLSVFRRRLLADPSDYQLFIEHESPRIVARQLSADLNECRARSPSKLPSFLALYMPPWPTPKAVVVAQVLAPYRDCNYDLLQLLYESKISEICRFLKGVPPRTAPEDESSIVSDEIARAGTTSSSAEMLRGSTIEARGDISQPSIPERDLVITASTLRQLFQETSLSDKQTGSEILAHILAQVEDSAGIKDAQEGSSWKETVEKYVASRSRPMPVRGCYVCGRQILKPHRVVSVMCVPCGDFNLAGSQLSLPTRLSLAAKVAAVTGARVNLGYHITLRLLRCGARVIASTRYPHDALRRYKSEKDAEEWMDRLLIVGADFRSARDAFELARETRRIVQGWGGTLHILINNAAQTLTDSIEKEKLSVRTEERLRNSTEPSLLLPPTSYVPKVRAGAIASIEGLSTQQLTTDTPKEASTVGSSWVQSLPEIPYEDIISAHSVNAFVPLILVRELLPIMSEASLMDKPPKGARGYIVNVSSREGVFEQSNRRDYGAKNGKYVHTNMSKAALNMITETEAAAAWRFARVAMNTVDPGYMSASPEFHAIMGGVMPLGWEDGAGRVLWPIAVGELEKIDEEGCHAVWGRFLKHYGASRVNLQQGMR